MLCDPEQVTYPPHASAYPSVAWTKLPASGGFDCVGYAALCGAVQQGILEVLCIILAEASQ